MNFAIALGRLYLIRGQSYKDAVAILKTTAKAAAEPVLKCTFKRSRGSEFAQLQTDHFLGDIYGNVLFAVVYRDGVSYEIGEDC